VNSHVQLKNIIRQSSTIGNSQNHYGTSTKYGNGNGRRQTCVVICT